MKPITNEEFDHFKELCLSQEGWNEVITQEKLKAYTKKTETSTLKLKVITTVFDEFDMNTLFDVLMDTMYRSEWDTNVMEKKIIEQIDDYNEIQYYQVKMPVVTNRDFVYIKAWRYVDDEFIIFNRSVEDAREPPRSNFVRGSFEDCGYFVRKEEGKIVLYYIIHNEWNGWIPAFLVNKLGVQVCPNVIAKLAEGCRKYNDWKSKQNDHKAPWKALLPKKEE